MPPPPRRSPPAPGQLLMVELRGTTTLSSPFHRRLHYDSFSPDYLSQPIAMVDQGQHDADMPTAMAFYTWAATSRSIVRRSLAAQSSFFLVALTATLLPLQPVGPDGLRIMIGASARQEPGSEDTRPVRGENPEFLHTVTTMRRNFERQFSPVRRPCGCGSSSVSRVAAGLSSPPRQSSGSGVGAVSV